MILSRVVDQIKTLIENRGYDIDKFSFKIKSSKKIVILRNKKIIGFINITGFTSYDIKCQTKKWKNHKTRILNTILKNCNKDGHKKDNKDESKIDCLNNNHNHNSESSSDNQYNDYCDSQHNNENCCNCLKCIKECQILYPCVCQCNDDNNKSLSTDNELKTIESEESSECECEECRNERSLTYSSDEFDPINFF